MATSLKNLEPLARTALAELRRVAGISSKSALAEANRWFSRERAWIQEQHLALCRIAAPTFFESARAEWLRNLFGELGWSASLDRAGNVLATFGSDDSERPLVVSAHLDTVFAPQREDDITLAADGRLHGPGVSDNGSGLVALLALARVLAETSALAFVARSVVLVGNVGEEGEGNLSGMRYLCRHPARLAHVRGFLVLDGPSTDHVTAQALASRRFEVLFHGPGGHSWNDSGTPNPVHALGHVISGFSQAAEARVMERPAPSPRFSFNFGIVEGGASVNSIPATARAKLDLRSEDIGLLDELGTLLNTIVERSLERENRPRTARATGRLTAKIRDLGSRPGGSLALDSPLLRTVQAVDAHLNIRSRVDCASTDANVPLSIGLPAISIGAGGHGGGAHTADEWYAAEGRELGLSRILLLLAALCSDDDPGQ